MPVNRAYQSDLDHHLHPFTTLPGFLAEGPSIMTTASGVTVRDMEGRQYIDGAAGLWCVNVGYGREEIVAAATKQMQRLPFFQCFNGTTNEATAQLSERIASLAPPGMERVFFGNSGSDANDTAVKLVWLYNNLRGKPQQKTIIARRSGYHGVTVASGSLPGLPNVHRLFDLPLPMVRHVSEPDTYHAPDRTAADYAEEVDALIRSHGAETVGAFIAEPVMGTGGVLVPPAGYFDAIAKVLAEHDVLLILDEVISGFGRLGHWFGAQKFNVTPDLITTAKGLTSSYLPMSAVILGEKLWSVMEAERKTIQAFGHGFTTTGHPVAAAVALANLDIIEREGLVARAAESGAYLLDRLREAIGSHPNVGDIRGDGLMVGIELVADREERRSFPSGVGAGARLAALVREEGVLVRALPRNDVIALSPAFIIEEAEMDGIVAALTAALGKFDPNRAVA